jgi:hypothetical protein
VTSTEALRIAADARAKGIRADLTRADLTRADLTRADLTDAYLSGADLTDANLSGANLSWSDLAGANLTRADLAGAYLTRADLTGADLTDANLTGVDLSWANLAGANLAGANLAGAYLAGAYLTRADLTGANLAGADLTNTCLDLSATPNGDVSAFERAPDDDAYVIGYRTRNKPYMGGPDYVDGETYTAPWFSVSATDCHPGLYLQPERDGIEGDAIRCRALVADGHRAGTKWRFRAFTVLGPAVSS